MSLAMKNVVKQVGGETHIYETTIELAETGFNILLGTTLSGKTTLMLLMAGLERPTSGEIWFKGRNVTGVSVQKRNVSMVHQQFINYPNLSVYENIASPLRVAGMSRAEIDRRVGEAAELLRLTPMLKRRPLELSGGQQQRTALARALVKDSELVLLDEPLANLDFKLREELRDELPRLFAHRGATVVYATSEPTEALLLGGHTATLHEGRVAEFGETAAIYRRPATLTSAQVFSDPPINIAPVVKTGSEMALNGTVRWRLEGEAAALPDGDYSIGIRPHHVTASPSEGAAKVSGRVLVTELSGSESVIHFDLGDGAAKDGADGLVWVSQSHGVHAMKVGDHADFYVDVGRALIFDAEGRLAA